MNCTKIKIRAIRAGVFFKQLLISCVFNLRN
jgi:hypothetical protein